MTEIESQEATEVKVETKRGKRKLKLRVRHTSVSKEMLAKGKHYEQLFQGGK